MPADVVVVTGVEVVVVVLVVDGPVMRDGPEPVPAEVVVVAVPAVVVVGADAGGEMVVTPRPRTENR